MLPEQRLVSFGPTLLGCATLFLLFEFAGAVYPQWINGNLCFPYIGCNAGFFGFDGVIHVFAGIAEALTVVWLTQRFVYFNFLRCSKWALFAVTTLGLVSLVSIGWELFEYSYDVFRAVILHVHATPLGPVFLAQPSNADTMGDLTTTLAGAAITLLVLLGRNFGH